MKIASDVTELIGNTPLVRLNKVTDGCAAQVVAKLESSNPCASVKDRIGVSMITEAERAGRIHPGKTVLIEPTSGNTGIGLAFVAAVKGYKLILTMPETMSLERRVLLLAFGAEIVLTPGPNGMKGAVAKAEELLAKTTNGFMLQQFDNPDNPKIHFETTGPEIWNDTEGRADTLISGIGTGGTICGIGRYLKSQNPDVQIVGADPEGSVYSGGSGRPYLVEGIGEDFWPTTYDPQLVDRVVMVSDADSFLTARRLAVVEGILAGGSTGTAVWAALQLAPELRRDDVVVVLVPDSGRGYLSKLYNDEWMADHGFLRTSGHTVADLLESKGDRLPGMIHVHPDETARQAVAVMAEYDVSQIAVIQAEPPLAAAEVIGAVHEHHLMQRALQDPQILDKTVGEIMDPPLPSVGSGETVDVALRRLEESPAVTVLDNGHPVGIITRSDALAFLAQAGSPREAR